MQYLIRTDEPFCGHCESVLNKDGTVGYTNGLTIEQYEQEQGYKLKVLSEAEFNKLYEAWERKLITKPKRITKERYWEMLVILPPSRFHYVGGFEVFHISERLVGELVSWFANRNDRYYEWTDYSYLGEISLASRLHSKLKSP